MQHPMKNIVFIQVFLHITTPTFSWCHADADSPWKTHVLLLLRISYEHWWSRTSAANSFSCTHHLQGHEIFPLRAVRDVKFKNCNTPCTYSQNSFAWPSNSYPLLYNVLRILLNTISLMHILRVTPSIYSWDLQVICPNLNLDK